MLEHATCSRTISRMRSSPLSLVSGDQRWGMLEYSTLTVILSGRDDRPAYDGVRAACYNLALSMRDSRLATLLQWSSCAHHAGGTEHSNSTTVQVSCGRMFSSHIISISRLRCGCVPRRRNVEARLGLVG
jgi:hypothetical protein